MEWIYDERKTDIIEQPPPVELSLIVPPPQEDVTRLYGLVQQGNIKAIIDYAEEIEMLDKKFTPFVNELRLLAKGFKVKQMHTFVKQFLD